MHLSDNIKIVRALLKESQDDFRKRFTDITLGKQKSYEQGAANPGYLYMAEIVELAGVSEHDFRNKKLTKQDITIKVLPDSKDKKGKEDKNVFGGTSKDQLTVEKLQDFAGKDSPLLDLILSNKALAEASKIQAERDKIKAEADKIREEKEKLLVQSNADLAAQLKSTESVPEDNPLAHPVVQMRLLETLAELGAGSLWKTKEDGLILLGNRFAVPNDEAKKRESTHAGAGRKSIA